MRLNQVIAPIAKQMCRAELAKAFSHWLLEVGIARCEPHIARQAIALRKKKKKKKKHFTTAECADTADSERNKIP